MAEIVLKNVYKQYGHNPYTIKDVNLHIKEGEFCVFVGPSGCGKSTLLRMIAGLEDITSGELTIGGKRMNEKAPSERGVSMVFQSYALYPHMTVRENLSFGLKLAKTDKQTIDQKIQEAAKIVPLDRLLVETDAPYLAPVPYRGKRNEPGYTRYVVEKIAELREVSFEELAQQTTKNAHQLFRIS